MLSLSKTKTPEEDAESVIQIIGEIEEEMVTEAIKQIAIANLDKNVHEIIIWLNSNGGDTDAGFALYDAISGCSKPVIICCFGQVMSTALIVLQAADMRLAMPHTRFLHHQATGIASASTAKQAAQFAANYSYAKYTGDLILKKKAKIPDEIWENYFEDTYEFGSEEAYKYRIIDRVISDTASLLEPLVHDRTAGHGK